MKYLLPVVGHSPGSNRPRFRARLMPIQILEVRFEADTPDAAVDEAVMSLQVDGLDVRWIRSEA